MAKGFPDFSFTTHIRTLEADNIIIDKLKIGAYTERRSTLSNNGATPTLHSVGIATRRGKFFPRGCRGFIENINIYCDNADTADHFVYVWLSPHPSMGPIITLTLTVPAGQAAGWLALTVRRLWNYDSLFIRILCDNATYPRVGYDADEPFDAYTSSDDVTWTRGDIRWWIQAVMTGETVGDVPVSGTVNAVEVPASSSYFASVLVESAELVEVDVLTLMGTGICNHLSLCSEAAVGSHADKFRVYCDETLSFEEAHVVLSSEGVGASTPGVSLTTYLAGGFCVTKVSFPLAFKRSFRVTVTGSIGSVAHNTYAKANVRRLS